MTAILIWWFVSAHKWFKGPKVNVDHMMLGADVVEGQDPEPKGTDSDSSSGHGGGLKGGIPGEMAKGVQVGDIKSGGL